MTVHGMPPGVHSGVHKFHQCQLMFKRKFCRLVAAGCDQGWIKQSLPPMGRIFVAPNIYVQSLSFN